MSADISVLKEQERISVCVPHVGKTEQKVDSVQEINQLAPWSQTNQPQELWKIHVNAVYLTFYGLCTLARCLSLKLPLK